MFPNVRLMVVAILAAIAGISCGLGLFATFRVNHEPLARLAEVVRHCSLRSTIARLVRRQERRWRRDYPAKMPRGSFPFR